MVLGFYAAKLHESGIPKSTNGPESILGYADTSLRMMRFENLKTAKTEARSSSLNRSHYVLFAINLSPDILESNPVRPVAEEAVIDFDGSATKVGW